MGFDLGVVSNVWGALLRGSSLGEQCGLARQRGFGYVELRQRGLGECEEPGPDGRPLPLPLRLAELPEREPAMGFNLAVEAPFMTQPLDPEDPYLLRCGMAAAALGSGQGPAVLRLVDLSPAPGLLRDGETLEALAESLARVASRLRRDGVELAVENSKQPVGVLHALARRAGTLQGGGAQAPRLCWDPHNQISQKLLPEDPLETARTLPLDDLFELHFKQGRRGELQADVGDGEIPWREILEALANRGYSGPALFEIPAGPDIWERLDRSASYIRGLLA